LNIALIILHADPVRGGAERYTVDLATALGAAGHRVTLAHSSRIDEDVEVNEPGRPFRRIKLGASGFARPQRYQHFIRSAESLVTREKFDIVHAMLPVTRCDVYHPHAGMAIAAVKEKPVSALFNPRRRMMASVEQKLLKSPNPPRVLCLSEYVKRSVRKFYDLDDAHLPVLFNAVDLNRFEAPPPRPKRDGVNALIVAQDFERKGLADAIDAVAALRDQPLKLTVVGSDHEGPYRRRAQSLGIADRITFVGGALDPRPYYREADFFVLPTKHDPCSLVVLEALAMGLPVITTKSNGASEIMTDGVHGRVMERASETTDAMRTLLDPEARARMSASCIELRPRLSYEHHLRTLLGIYESVMNERQDAKMPRSATEARRTQSG
jgi:UDP-glucose:(heptosyl)LPS alpha-1,3-glucosyltransferase